MFSIVGSGLIYEIVEPVGVKQICTASPGYDGIEGIIIIREVINGNLDGKTRVFVAEILGFESACIVFRMTGDEDLSAAVCCASIKPRNGRGREDLKLGTSLNVFDANGGVARMRNEEFIVKSSEKHRGAAVYGMLENSEKLCVKRIFLDSVMVIKSRLRTPTDVEG